MKILCAFALTVAAFACGGGNTKKESAIVNEGSDVSPTCCCKTIPATAEKEIIPVYAQAPRMECSSSHGDCVDDVQCNNSANPQTAAPSTGTGTGGGEPPPPPELPSNP
jgi:hypothetical protein